MITVFVDAENVRRSRWPNVAREELVERCGDWSRSNGFRVLVVFDGQAPPLETGTGCEPISTGPESADDWIARTAADAEKYWLITSDRELRERAGGRAARVVGGGSFLTELGA